MGKSSGFFLIHNYNTVPDDLLQYCTEYLIMDVSDDPEVAAKLREREDKRILFLQNTGHNLTSYFTYFAENLDSLPEVLFLLKGNIIGRHVSAEYFERTLHNTWFTYLYEERFMRARYSRPTKEMLQENGGKDISEGSIANLLTECQFTEENSSWYMQTGTHPCRYFSTYDALLQFIYVDPVLPKVIAFAPGGCYIVRGDQVRQHGKAFYRNLNKLMNYTLEPGFPAEAYIIERMMPLFFESNYRVQPWMEDENLFDEKIREVEAQNKELEKQREEKQNSFMGRVKQTLKRVKG
ncbi:MAG: DUF3431 domain-containing protein [Lachnospiraceae bacterium]|nr:DUF3431 domain-containing protein [Lachnospiraceae bacterium]